MGFRSNASWVFCKISNWFFSSTCLCRGAATEWVGDSNSTERGDLLQGGRGVDFSLTYNQEWKVTMDFIWFWVWFCCFSSIWVPKKKVQVYPPGNCDGYSPYPTFFFGSSKTSSTQKCQFLFPQQRFGSVASAQVVSPGPQWKVRGQNWHPKLPIHRKKLKWDLSNRFFRAPFSESCWRFLGREFKVGWKFCWQFAAWIDGYPTHQKYLWVLKRKGFTQTS